MTSSGRPQDFNFKLNKNKYITFVLFSILLTKWIPWNTEKLAVVYSYIFLEERPADVLEMSVGRGHCKIPRTSVLNFSYECIFIALLSILFHQICASNTKDLAVIQFYVFGKMSQRCLMNVPKGHPEVDILRTSRRCQFLT